VDQWSHRFEAPEGLAPESQISPNDIQRIIAHLKLYQIHILFPETNVSRDSLKKIADAANELGLNVRLASKPLYGDAMGKPGSGADTYPEVILYNAKDIYENIMQ
jgi:manganese/zinc/iron transport system substrate-binding protein